MKKTIIAILCVVLMLSSLTCTASAQEKASVIIGSVTAKGKTVEVPVYITSIPAGLDNIMAIDFIYSYDKSVLEYKSLVKGTTTGNMCNSSAGSMHWVDTTDLAVGKAKITSDTIGEDYPFFTLVFDVIGSPVQDTEIVATSVQLTGGKLLGTNSIELVKASKTSFENVNGVISFPGFTFEQKSDAYGLGNSRVLIIDIQTEGVPYVDGVLALMVGENKFMCITDAQEPRITIDKSETAEPVKWGRLHRDDKVTALDALMIINISGGKVYDSFVEDKNLYIKADPDLDFNITSSDALAVNILSHGKNVTVTSCQ